MRQHSQVGQGQRFGLLPPQKDYIGVNLQATLLTWHDKGLEPGVVGLLDAARPPPVRDVDAQLHRDLAERSAGLEHLRAHSRPLKHLRRFIKCENPQSSVSFLLFLSGNELPSTMQAMCNGRLA